MANLGGVSKGLTLFMPRSRGQQGTARQCRQVTEHARSERARSVRQKVASARAIGSDPVHGALL